MVISMNTKTIMDDDWSVIESALPKGWRAMGQETKATRKLGVFLSDASLLRTLLLYTGKGYSFKETAARADLAGLAHLTSVGLIFRLRRSAEWLRRMVVALCQEDKLVALPGADLAGYRLRTVDATVVAGPGPSANPLRLHLALDLPTLAVSELHLTPTKGRGESTGEDLRNFAVEPGDVLMGDRAYASAAGIQHVADAGGFVLVRAHLTKPRLRQDDGSVFDLVGALSTLTRAGQTAEWTAFVESRDDGRSVPIRLCAVRKSRAETERAHERIRRTAQRKGRAVSRRSLEAAAYVVVATTLPAADFSTARVLDLYRARWQIELLFKRLKSLAGLGKVPTSNTESTRGWLYGKLLVCLLAEKLAREARAFSPWGYALEGGGDETLSSGKEPVAGVFVPAPRRIAGRRAFAAPGRRDHGLAAH
jgi:hypothetical protein